MHSFAYVDSSVLIRVILNESGKMLPLLEYKEIYASDLVRIECMRTYYRLKFENKITTQQLAEYVEKTGLLFKKLSLIPISRFLITRCTQALPIHVRSLDAIHLGTALLLAEKTNTDISFFTHDKKLAQAARAMGLNVVSN